MSVQLKFEVYDDPKGRTARAKDTVEDLRVGGLVAVEYVSVGIDYVHSYDHVTEVSHAGQRQWRLIGG